MSERVELTRCGLTVQDADGKNVFGLCFAVGERAAALIITGETPREIPLTLDAVKHLERVAFRVQHEAVTAGLAADDRALREAEEPRVPRREPELPAVASPWV